ncbi:MAG: lipopolysaccharide transport periplasmic protein LptA [Pseudomonadales bacterium]|nr:lipopolysaccharide transport periplasmic protein LptA [Pseudomonadales bacterium]
MLRRRIRISSRAVWLGCLVFLGSAARAESTQDASASQLTIEGDSAVFLQEQNTIEYVGNVVAFMDGMRIVGDRVLVEMNADRIERITTNGAPATFWQKRHATARDTTAAANTIVFLPDSSLLELSGSASLKQDGNEVSSALIRYDLTLGQLDAGSPNASQERVRMQLRVPTNSTQRSSEEP